MAGDRSNNRVPSCALARLSGGREAYRRSAARRKLDTSATARK
jgi:hypothetical protein